MCVCMGFAHLCPCTEARGGYWMSCSLFPPFDSLSLNLKHSVSHRLSGWVPGVYLPLLPNVGVAGMLTLCGCWVFELRSSRLEQKFLINWAISPIFVTLKAEPYPTLPVSLPRFLAFLYSTNLSCTWFLLISTYLADDRYLLNRYWICKEPKVTPESLGAKFCSEHFHI